MVSLKQRWLEYFAIRKSGFFDAYYYLKVYRDVRLADVDPLMHFITNGWQERRNPSFLFNTDYYLETNPDVKASGMNPLYHYVLYGKSEGRNISVSERTDSSDFHFSPPDFFPKVSVIVPNYNHAAYLEERLESIYAQTYQNIEVILLDDCSSDNSISTLKKYEKEHPEKTRCYFAGTNSGSPFSQWHKGIMLAEGELVWIAESDDFCEKDFLEKLVPFFSDESILLSYAHTIFVDGKGKRHSFAFENYIGQISLDRWNSSYVETAHNEVNTALGLLNTIPNVSSVIFRKPDADFPLFKNDGWKKMKVCGDWLFYLNLIRGGRIAYCHDTHNYYRIHQTSASKKTHDQDVYYQEHQMVACALAALYKIPDELIVRFQKRLRDFYFTNVSDGNDEKFDALFDLNNIFQRKKERKPNVLVATYGFAFGGGEIFPIRLANALRIAGAAVTFLNGGYEPTQLSVRKMLSPQIALIDNTAPLNVNDMLENFGIEIINSHHASMDNYFAVTRSKNSNGVKHVATMHGMYEMMSSAHFNNNTKDIRGSVDHWVFTAEKNLRPFKKKGIFSTEKFTRIDNGMGLQDYQKIDLSPLGITPDSITACLASRALADKGWVEAIESTKKAREITQKDIHLILIGEGPMYETLKNTELPGFIHLLGYKADLDDYLASSQLGLLPTYFKGESFPLVLIECFMVGIPVIATNIGEISRMMKVDDTRQGGLIIELHDGKVDIDDLTGAMIKLITDKEFYDDCLLSVGYLKNRFDIKNTAQQYLDVFKRALGEN